MHIATNQILIDNMKNNEDTGLKTNDNNSTDTATFTTTNSADIVTVTTTNTSTDTATVATNNSKTKAEDTTDDSDSKCYDYHNDTMFRCNSRGELKKVVVRKHVKINTKRGKTVFFATDENFPNKRYRNWVDNKMARKLAKETAKRSEQANDKK